jgi:small-conductance mechanosensitive channel
MERGRVPLARAERNRPLEGCGSLVSMSLPPLRGAYADLALVALLAVSAWTVHRASWGLARRAVRLSQYAHRAREQRPERRVTLQGVVANAISLLAVAAAVAVGFVRVLQISPDTVVWSVGLFSVAFGLAARPILADVFSGASLVFEDNYTVGEKVEMAGVVGVVEEVALRTTRVRGDTGELFVVPNGEVRVVRNFSRGEFSLANVTVTVPANELGRALEVLAGAAAQAPGAFSEVAESIRIISETGRLGATAEVTLVVKATYAQGAELRPRLMAWVRDRLADAGLSPLD